VQKMQCMFYEAKALNQPIGGCAVSNVEYIEGMFNGRSLDEANNPDLRSTR